MVLAGIHAMLVDLASHRHKVRKHGIADGAGHLGSIHSFPEQKVLYRSDTKDPLSVVSQRYKVVQPEEVFGELPMEEPLGRIFLMDFLVGV